MAQTLDDKTAKRILDMLARKIGGYAFTMCKSCLHPIYNIAIVGFSKKVAPNPNHYMLKACFTPIYAARRCKFIYKSFLKKMLEIALENDITAFDGYKTFMQKGITLDELLVQLDLEV